MKTSKIFMTTLVALTMTACSNDNDWVNQPGNPDVIAPDAYTSFSISIPHASKTRVVSADPGIATESAVESLHVLIYDAEPPNAPTVAEFTVAGGALTQKPAGSSTWVTSQPVSTRKTSKYIFVEVNPDAEIVDYITSNGLGAFSYKDFTQEIAKLMDQTNGFVMFNSTHPALTLATDLYERKSKAKDNHIAISVNRVTAKAAVFQSQSFVVSGGRTMIDLKFGWRNLNKKFYFIRDDRDALIKNYNQANYTAEDFTRGIDVTNVYTSADVPTSLSYAMENTFQYISGASNVDAATFIDVSGVFTPTNTVSTKINPSTVAADFEIIVNPKPADKTFSVVRTTDGVVNYFIGGPTAEKFIGLCIANTPQVPSINEAYLLSENTYSSGLCYYRIFVNGGAVTPQVPYNIYRDQYFKININSIQAPGSPPDSFDSGEPIKPNSWIGVDIQIIPWEVTEGSHDL